MRSREKSRAVCSACGWHGTLTLSAAGKQEQITIGAYALLWFCGTIAGFVYGGIAGGFIMSVLLLIVIGGMWMLHGTIESVTGGASPDFTCPLCGRADALLPEAAPVAQKLLRDLAEPIVTNVTKQGGVRDDGSDLADRDPLLRQAAEVCVQHRLGSASE